MQTVTTARIEMQSDEFWERRAVFVEAMKGLFESYPLPPLPYPDNPRRLKRLKSIMRTQMNRERWLSLLLSRAKLKSTRITATEFLRAERFLKSDTLRVIAEECKVPEQVIRAVHSLIYDGYTYAT